MKRNRWFLIIAVAAAVLLAIAYGFMAKPVSVDIVKVSRGPMSVTIEEEGKTRVRDRFVISAPVSGYLRRITLKAGDHVKAGQTVLELEPLRSNVLDPRSRAAAEAAISSAEAALKAAEENGRAAEADAEYVRANLERTRKLFQESLVSKDMMDRIESEAKHAEAMSLSAKAAVKAAHFELERARTALGHSPLEGAGRSERAIAVRSPVTGDVLKIYRESEGTVNTGEPLIDIGDPLKLEVRVEVLSADAVKIRPGMPVLFERWGGGSALTGKVRVIEPSGFTKVSSLGVEEQRVFVVADIATPPEGRMPLGDGYRLEARFVIWENKDVLQVPSGALFRKGEGWSLFVVRESRAEQRQVEIGRRNGLTAEILSGLAEGEQVITHPDDSVKNGVRVRAR